MPKCSFCERHATATNSEEIPVCAKHTKSKGKAPLCPEHKIIMTLRKGKFGVFWGCQFFPECHEIKKA